MATSFLIIVVRICSGAIHSKSNGETQRWPLRSSATDHWYPLVWGHSAEYTFRSSDNRSLSRPSENRRCSFSTSSFRGNVWMSWICNAYPVRDGYMVDEDRSGEKTYSNEIVEHGPFEIPIEFDFLFLQDILVENNDSYFPWSIDSNPTFRNSGTGVRWVRNRESYYQIIKVRCRLWAQSLSREWGKDLD